MSSPFSYYIPPGGTYPFQTNSQPAAAQVIPDIKSGLSAGAGIFGRTVNGVLATETSVPSAAAAAHVRVFIDRSGNHDSSLAIAAVDNLPLSARLQAFQSDGVTSAGDQGATVHLAGDGHQARCVWQRIIGLPADFRGVPDISSAIPFSALTLSFLTNELGVFLLTTFPVTEVTKTAPAPLIFPRHADGGGYRTEFTFLSAGAAAQANMNFFGIQGSPLLIARQ